MESDIILFLDPIQITAAMLLAFIIDRFIGWPEALYRRISHPVVFIGWLISSCDRYLNQNSWTSAQRRIAGLFTVAIILGLITSLSLFICHYIPRGLSGLLILALLSWPFLAVKSLYDHVMAVALPLQKNDLEAARSAVSMIVGRNPDQLDQTAITRAALESLAENTSDGVVAPLFWGVLLGFPGLVLYKSINTMDSMIGYQNQRYKDFGWAAAKLDDVVNWIPARITGILYSSLAPHSGGALKIMRQEAPNHRSPNAGWPEAAFAAALGLRLSGPRYYDNQIHNEAWLNKDGRDPTAQDMLAGLALYRRLSRVIAGLLLALIGIEILVYGVLVYGAGIL